MNAPKKKKVCEINFAGVYMPSSQYPTSQGCHNNVFQAEVCPQLVFPHPIDPLLQLPVVDQSLGKKLKEKKTVTTVNSKEWPGHAQLVPPPSGKDLWLNDQHPLLQFVIQGGIANVTAQILVF